MTDEKIITPIIDRGSKKPKAKKIMEEVVEKKPKEEIAEAPKPEEEVVEIKEVVEDGKIVRFEMGATINTGQYENIQPKIEIATSDLSKATHIAMGYMKELTQKYSINGGIKEKSVGEVKELESFNEEGVKIDFEPITHTYTAKDGKKLIGATTYIQRFYKKFDASAIAKVCAKAWDVEQKLIEGMWTSNGDISSMLGTLVDNALEHYNEYYEIGVKISEKNKKDNPAMPKHPIVRNIIEQFHKLPHKEGKVLHQVFVTDTENGLCGQLDRLIITGDKKCIIQDFKVQIDSDKEDKNNKALAPFDILPPTKITKYALQVNLYRQLLEKSGWTVEGMEAVVYEDEWKVYQLEKIQVI